MGLCRALAARVDEFDPEKNEDEEVKTYPVADGGCARHLRLMLQRGAAGCTAWRSCARSGREKAGRSSTGCLEVPERRLSAAGGSGYRVSASQRPWNKPP